MIRSNTVRCNYTGNMPHPIGSLNRHVIGSFINKTKGTGIDGCYWSDIGPVANIQTAGSSTYTIFEILNTTDRVRKITPGHNQCVQGTRIGFIFR